MRSTDSINPYDRVRLELQYKYKLPFPDEDHACEPLRQIQFAKLKQNALPPAPNLSLYASPLKRKQPKTHSTSCYSPVAPSVQQLRKSMNNKQRNINQIDSKLWGFSVRFSPKGEIQAQWETTEVKLKTAIQAENRRQQEQARLNDQRQEREEMQRRDYNQYLYLVSKYGALDALLFCCSPWPGRIYAVLIDCSARKLQRWLQERLHALRRYWIVHLSRQLVATSLDQSLKLVVQHFEKQTHATTFLKRLQSLHAAKALQKWAEYTQRQAQVRWRFHCVLKEDLRSRFLRWKECVQARKDLRKRLKDVAKHKRMAAALQQWTDWKITHEKLRLQLIKHWNKLQRDCMTTWRLYTQHRKRSKVACITIQRVWRGYFQYRQYQKKKRAALLIEHVFRGWKVHRYALELRSQMEISQVLLQLTYVVAWNAHCDKQCAERESLFDRERVRAQREEEYIAEVRSFKTAFVQGELNKVLRNAMHEELETQMEWLRDHEVDPYIQHNSQALKRMGIERLLNQEIEQATQTARNKFRCESPQNSLINGCLICSTSVAYSVVEGVIFDATHDCIDIRTQAFNETLIGNALVQIYEHERVFAAQLLERPVAGPIIWRFLCQHSTVGVQMTRSTVP